MRAVPLALAFVVVGCGEDVEGPLRGSVTVVTAPGARVDFMSAGSDKVFISMTADANGRATTLIDHGDRAVIVMDPTANNAAIIVLDELVPEQEYRWYVGSSQQPSSTNLVTVTYPAVPGASYYAVSSRCGGSSGPVSGLTTQAFVCDQDALLVVASDAAGDVVSSAYQVVTAPGPGQTIAIAQPFQPPRPITFTLRGAPAGDVQLFATLYTRDDLSYQIRIPLGTEQVVPVPDLDATLLVQSFISAPGGSIKQVYDQHPIADSVTLDFSRRVIPDVVSQATYYEEASVFTWEIAGEGIPDAAAVEVDTAFGGRLVVIAPYRGPRLHLPLLPRDIAGQATPSLIRPFVVASPGGFAAAVSAYGRLYDPAHPALELYTSGFYP